MNAASQGESVSRSLLRKEALRRGLQISYIGVNDHFMKITDNTTGHFELFYGTLTLHSSSLGNIIANRKNLTIDFVQSLGFTTPDTRVFESLEQAHEFLRRHGSIVVKPADALQSKGVTVGVDNPEKLQHAVDYARGHSLRGIILLQEQLAGKLYRLFVLDGKLVAAAHRKAAEVLGDGSSTIEELVRHANIDPRRSNGNTTPLKIISTEAAEKYVGADRFRSVPAAGEIVRVSAIDSISAGGEAANVTPEVHPEYIRIAERIASELKLFVCGVDLLCEDIAEEPKPGFFPILELNSMPGLKLHHFPTAGGDPINLARLMLDKLFPIRSRA